MSDFSILIATGRSARTRRNESNRGALYRVNKALSEDHAVVSMAAAGAGFAGPLAGVTDGLRS